MPEPKFKAGDSVCYRDKTYAFQKRTGRNCLLVNSSGDQISVPMSKVTLVDPGPARAIKGWAEWHPGSWSQFPKVPPGEKRQWKKCKTCSRVYYRDYVPFSLSNPVMWTECGHWMEDQRTLNCDNITAKVARAIIGQRRRDMKQEDRAKKKRDQKLKDTNQEEARVAKQKQAARAQMPKHWNNIRVGDSVWVWDKSLDPDEGPVEYEVYCLVEAGQQGDYLEEGKTIWFAPKGTLQNGPQCNYKAELVGLYEFGCDEWSESVFFDRRLAIEASNVLIDAQIAGLDERIKKAQASKKALKRHK